MRVGANLLTLAGAIATLARAIHLSRVGANVLTLVGANFLMRAGAILLLRVPVRGGHARDDEHRTDLIHRGR